MPRFDLVIFDVDGTLLDSLAGIVRAMTEAWQTLGLPGELARSDVANVVGLSLPQAAARLLPQGTPAQWQSLADEYKKEFRRLSDTGQIGTTLFPHVRETIHLLHREGITMALATGKSMAGVQRNLKEHNLEGVFQVIKTADCAPSKPDPGMLIQILEETGIPANRTLMVGDTEFDMDMGKRAGVATCAVDFGCHSREQLRRTAPDYWIDAMDRLPTVVGLPDLR